MQILSIEQLPKAELHVHMDGVLNLQLHDQLCAQGLRPVITREQLSELLPVNTKQDWIERYAPRVDATLIPPEIWLPRLALAYIQSVVPQNVRYLEIMTNGLLFTQDPDAGRCIGTYEQLRADIDDFLAGMPPGTLEVNLTVAVGRREPVRMMRQAERCLELHRRGLITGFAVAGDEGFCTIASIKDVLDKVHASGLKVEIHAGEWCGPASVWDALIHGRPHRLGHGLAVFRDERLLAEVLKRDIHIEFCPTSNLKTGAIDDLADHPIARALDLGMNFSVNTDDPGPFECSMNSEFALVADLFGFTTADFDRIYANTMRSRFAG